MFVDYLFTRAPELPAFTPGRLYEYIVGANGIFVRAERPGLEALIQVGFTRSPIRGLAEVVPHVRCDPVQVGLMARMFEKAYRAGGREILFYLTAEPWRCFVPEQVQSGGAVRPSDPFAGGANTVIEVHSHHTMGCFFSRTDDAEEKAGFRVYAVMGDLARRPSILVRVGIYGHFQEIPADWVFDLPDGVTDALFPEVVVSEEELQYAD